MTVRAGEVPLVAAVAIMCMFLKRVFAFYVI